MSICWLDFETRSRCDLKKHGAYIYAKDPSTEVLCLCYAFDDGEVQTWDPMVSVFPVELDNFKGQIRAHNASFERLIFKYVLGCDFQLEQFYCTATQARANCMPGGLGDLGRFAGLGMQKDYRGAQLIRWLSIPQADGSFNEDPKLMDEMIAYCRQDVEVMREASKAMRDLSEEELYDYHVNERINDLGVRVDMPLCEAAVKYADAEKEELERLVADITEGEITSVRSRKMCQWVYDRVGAEGRRLMEGYVDGEKKISIDKTVRANLLDLAEGVAAEVPPEVADVVQCADDLWASSVAKFTRMVDLSDNADHRVRGAFIFAGGAATGRAASYGLQVHNISRKCAKDPEAVRASMTRGHQLVPKHGPAVTEVLKGMLRPAFIPKEGNIFVVADWSAIEGRVNPWLANSAEGEAKLDQYRKGLDPYIVNASATFGVPYEEIYKGYKAELPKYDSMRQCGKVQELALSYGGKTGSFDQFAAGYKLSMTEGEVQRAISAWTRNNPWMSTQGSALDTAVWSAMRHKGREFSGPRVTYMFDGVHLWYVLPSGRILCYPFAKIEKNSVTYAKSAWKPKSDAKEWPRARLWFGDYLNNTTQATANDLLRHALRELDDLYYDIVLHVHDEIVLEVKEEDADKAIEDMTRIMTTPPSWAEGMPLNIGIKKMKRYGK